MNINNRHLKFVTKHTKISKHMAYWEQYNYYNSMPAIWMSRGDETHQLCQGYWLLSFGSLGPMEGLRFTAADPHWVEVNYRAYSDKDVEEFKNYMDQQKIIWR